MVRVFTSSQSAKSFSKAIANAPTSRHESSFHSRNVVARVVPMSERAEPLRAFERCGIRTQDAGRCSSKFSRHVVGRLRVGNEVTATFNRTTVRVVLASRDLRPIQRCRP